MRHQGIPCRALLRVLGFQRSARPCGVCFFLGMLGPARRGGVVVHEPDLRKPWPGTWFRLEVIHILEGPEPVVSGVHPGIVSQAATKLEVGHDMACCCLDQVLRSVLAGKVRDVSKPPAVLEDHIVEERGLKYGSPPGLPTGGGTSSAAEKRLPKEGTPPSRWTNPGKASRPDQRPSFRNRHHSAGLVRDGRGLLSRRRRCPGGGRVEGASREIVPRIRWRSGGPYGL